MNDFLKLILGDQTKGSFLAYLLFAIIGIIIKLLYHVTQRDANSPNTPVAFSWKFMLTDNALRLFASLALSLFVVIICIRFCNEILNTTLSPIVALLIGYGSDMLAERLKALAASKFQSTPIETTATDQDGNVKKINPEKPADDQIDTGNVVKTTVTEEAPGPAADQLKSVIPKK